MVRAKARISFSWPERKEVPPKYNLRALSDVKEPFQLKLSNRYAILEEISDPDDIYEKITSGILEVAEETLPVLESPQCNWMSPETKLAIDKKHKIRKQKGHKSAEYKAAKAESKKSVQKDMLKQVEEQIDGISTLPPHKQYYAAIKRLKSKQKNISWGVKNKKGEVVTDKVKILERWAEFYEELYADDPSTVNMKKKQYQTS